jgi:hypothetical protein
MPNPVTAMVLFFEFSGEMLLGRGLSHKFLMETSTLKLAGKARHGKTATRV